MISRRIVTGALAGLAILAASACGDDGDDRVGDVPGDLDVAVGDDVPDDFPIAEVPLPDTEVVSSASLGRGARQSWTIVYGVDDVAGAAERYRDELEAAGFTLEAGLTSEDDEGELASFTATGADHIVTAFAGGARGESTLSVTVAPLLADER